MSKPRDIERLLRQASSHEIPVVTNLALAAGIYWRCRFCKAVGDEGEDLCPKCHRSKKS